MKVKVFGLFVVLLSSCGNASVALSSPPKSSEPCDHFWEEISNTATCTEGGIVSYKCVFCEEVKTEKSQAFGHDFNATGLCGHCGEFEYDITVKNTFPSVYQSFFSKRFPDMQNCSFQIDSISFRLVPPGPRGERTLRLNYVGTKISDSDGESGKFDCDITAVLTNEEGEIIDDQTDCGTGGRVTPNQPFENWANICREDVLDVNAKYFLEIKDGYFAKN